MKIDDADFEELLALFGPENVPEDPVEARQAIENFVDLVELLMRPLPLPPAGGSSFTQPSSDVPEPSSPPLLPTGLIPKARGRDSGIGFEHR